jgi:cell division septum initiation protein DivIVA
MPIADDIRMVLEIEREGKKRLAEAQEEADRIVGRAREEAGRILEKGEQAIARQRKERTATMQTEIAAEVEALEQRFRGEEERLRRVAESNREKVFGRIMNWLWGES